MNVGAKFGPGPGSSLSAVALSFMVQEPRRIIVVERQIAILQLSGSGCAASLVLGMVTVEHRMGQHGVGAQKRLAADAACTCERRCQAHR